MATFSAEIPSLLRRILRIDQYTDQPDAQADKSRTAWFRPAANDSPVLLVLLGVSLLAIPVVIYYITVYTNAYNFPYEDDFNSALSFVNDFAFGGLDTWGKLKLIVWQYNEHRIVFDRIVFLTDYWLFGQLNFRHLILIGNVSLLLIGWLFIKVTFRTLPIYQKLLFLLPVSWSLFSFQYWELSTWSMAALQNLFVIPFALLSLYGLTKPGRKAFVLACAAAILATYTSGNGLFSFMAGVPLLLLLKSYRRLALWLLAGAVAVGLYFVNYIRPPYHPDIVDSLVNHTGRAITYFFMLTGSLAGAGRPKAAFLFGVILLLITLGLVAYLWYTKRLTAHLTLLSWLLFFYLTCLSLMASRSGLGEGQAFTPRYGIVVVMLFATQAMLAIEASTKGWLRVVTWGGYTAIVLLFYFSANNQSNRQRLVDRTQQLQYSTAFFNQNPTNLFLHWGSPGVAEPIFTEARKNGVFQVPHLTFHDLKSTPAPFDASTLVPSGGVTFEVKPYDTPDFLVLYRSWALLSNSLPRTTVIQLVAQSATSSYVFATQEHSWDDVTDHTLDRHYQQPGFSCVIAKRDLKPGQYALWLRLTNGDMIHYQRTDVVVDI